MILNFNRFYLFLNEFFILFFNINKKICKFILKIFKLF